jgi:hypothetical protein
MPLLPHNYGKLRGFKYEIKKRRLFAANFFSVRGGNGGSKVTGQ